MANNRAIGLNNRMPWHLSADLKRFKLLTMSHPIIMGRLTFEAIGKPLPGRTNIIVSRNPAYQQEGCVVENSLVAAINHGCRLADEIFIIGGATLYETGFPLADRLYLTQINQDFEGDTFFPPFDPSDWLETGRQDILEDTQAGFSYSFIDLQRLK